MAENKDYKLVQFKAGDYKDRNGNYWCDAAFEGVSEPVKWVMQEKTVQTIKEGETYYGNLTDETFSTGRPYVRFHREKKQDVDSPSSSNGAKSNYVPRDDEAIKKQWAYGRAYEVNKPKTHEDWLKVKSDGDKLLSFVNNAVQAVNPVDEVFPVEEQENFSLDDIPF